MAKAAAAPIDEKNSASATTPAPAQILTAFRRDLHPATHAEDILVQIMARSFYCALRATRIETTLIDAQMSAIADHPSIQAYAKKHGTGFDYDTRRLGQAFESDCANRSAQPKITRTSSTHDQAFLRAQTSLRKLQSNRHAEAKQRAA